MSGDPRQCREQAAECVRLANQGTTLEARDEFIELAEVWLKLASAFDSDDAMLDMWSDSPRAAEPAPHASLQGVTRKAS
jgi:hypothetical protein